MMSTKTTRPELWLSLLWALLLIFGLSGCDGDDGNDGADGQDGRDATVSSTAVSGDEIVAAITGVSVASPPVVDFTIKTKPDASIRDTGIPGLDPAGFRFYMARLEPGAAAGDSSQWVSYYGPGFDRDDVNDGGTFVDNGDGSYRYTFAKDITAEPGYNPAATHRLVIEIRDVPAAVGEAVIINPYLDFRPDGGALTLTRDIAEVEANCNSCHGVLAFHGSDKNTVQVCTVCHGAGPTSRDTSDFNRMVHKIHVNHFVAVDLPTDPLRDGEAVHPQDTRNCATCHNQDNASTPNALNWFSVPNQEACSACHDGAHCSTDGDPTVPDQGAGDSIFCGDPVAHMDGQPNANCSTCHTAGGVGDPNPGIAGHVQASHVIASQVAAAAYQYNILSIDDGAGNAQVAPGGTPSVTFTITDPTNVGGANDPDGLGERYDLSGTPIADPALAGANTRMTVAWETAEYTNEGAIFAEGNNAGNPVTEAQPPRTTVITGGALAAGIVDNLDRSYTVTVGTVPTGTTGSGAVTIEGHPNDGTGNLAVRSEVAFFPITDSSAEPRRTVVRIGENCNDCHQQLALHGANRVDNEQDCVTCHNPNATDLNRRPADPNTTPDLKAEQSIDFKYMVHAIHAANITVYGYGNSVNDFFDVAFPGPQLSNCLACHAEDAYYPDSNGPILGTTIQSGADRTTGDDNIRISPFTSVCAGCHVPDAERDDPASTNAAKLHMVQNGGNFALAAAVPGPADPIQETCSLCHGEGRSVDIGVVHGLK
jgi:OmcA/MtrC family decaheme c-type cytochrome